MKEMSQMEIEYENYLSADDTIIEVDGKLFYKIVHKDRISLDEGIVLVCVPWKLFNDTAIDKVKDENNNVFKLGAPVHYSFRRPVPQWYMETVTVTVNGIHEICQIGEYLALES